MSMYNRIIDLQKLGAAWDRVKKNRPAPGADQVTFDAFEANRKAELMQLHTELLEHRYEPGPVREVTLYKGEKARTIALFCMRDKVVQQAAAEELSRLYEPRFPEFTFAYRPGRSALQITELLEQRVKSYDWFLKCDLKSYFDCIDRGILLADMRSAVREQEVLELIKIMLESRVLEADTGELLPRPSGVFQGSAMAPVLSNIYLMHFDEEMGKNCALYVRYSDDILILGNSRTELETRLSGVRLMLGERRLELQEKKTGLGEIKDGFEFLGYAFGKDGKHIPVKAEQSLQERLEEMWLTSHGDANQKLKKGAEITGGWEQYYRQDRQPGGILEYAVSLYMIRNKPDVKLRKKAGELRKNYQNVYRDLTTWLKEYWADWGQTDLQLYEYEQYFRMERMDAGKTLLPASAQFKEALSLFELLLIHEEQENLNDLLQIYADAGCYQKAAYLQMRQEKAVHEGKKLERDRGDGRDAVTETIREKSSSAAEWKPSAEELQQYMALFCGREELYAFEQTVQGRRKTETEFAPLTDTVIRKHLHGELTVSTYVQRANGTAHFLVFDIDVSKKYLLQYPPGTPQFEQYLKKAEAVTLEMKRFLAACGLRTYPEFSGYRGYHLWLFFSEWIPLRYLNLLQDALERERLQKGLTEDEIQIEYFPNRQRPRPDKPGQCIKLPLGTHTKSAKNSLLLDDEMRPVEEKFIGGQLRDAATYSLAALKKVLGAFVGDLAAQADCMGAKRQEKQLDNDLSGFGVLDPAVESVLKNCNLMLYLCQKARKTGYLPHMERLSILYVFGHLGDAGKAFVHMVMGFALNYQYNVTERFIVKLPEKPISCVKLRDQYKTVTAECGCSCRFRRTKNCYPSPVLHALQTSGDEAAGITLPSARTLSREKEKELYEEINIPKKVQELSEKIVEFKKQKRGIDRGIEKLEKELEQIFDAAALDCMEIPMGVLLRRKKIEGGYEWLIEL